MSYAEPIIPAKITIITIMNTTIQLPAAIAAITPFTLASIAFADNIIAFTATLMNFFAVIAARLIT